MLIIVKGQEIETKEIIRISNSEDYHGFIIYLTGKRSVGITEPETYSMSNREKAQINDKYRALRTKVEEEWKKDKTEFIILDL